MVVKGEQKVWVNISPCIFLQFAAERQRSEVAEVLGSEFPRHLRLTAPLYREGLYHEKVTFERVTHER